VQLLGRAGHAPRVGDAGDQAQVAQLEVHRGIVAYEDCSSIDTNG
jgi:hypothetical protein